MAKFTFKLESVRALREQAEQRAQEDLARELMLAAGRVEALARAADAVARARTAVATCGGETLTPQELVARQAFLERREREQHVARAEVDLQAYQVEQRRASLERAARDREILERAKDKARDAHVKAEQKADEELLGEIAITAHRRRSVGTAA